MYNWKIRVAKDYAELEKLVERIQDEGWTIDKIDMKTVSVIAYKRKDQFKDRELLTEQQDEGNINPADAFEWDGDYGQQST